MQICASSFLLTSRCQFVLSIAILRQTLKVEQYPTLSLHVVAVAIDIIIFWSLTFQHQQPVVGVVLCTKPDPDAVPEVSQRSWDQHEFDAT